MFHNCNIEMLVRTGLAMGTGQRSARLCSHTRAMKYRLSNIFQIAVGSLTILATSQAVSPVRAGEDCKGVLGKVSRSHGAYFGFFGGVTLGPDVQVGGLLSGYSTDADESWVIGAEWGYEFNTCYSIRPSIEAEVFYTDYDFTATNGAGVAQAELEHLNFMLNLILALDLEDSCSPGLADLHPYLGVGIGGSHTSAGNHSLNGTTFASGSSFSLATQVLVGVEKDLSDCFSLYGEFRWLDVADLPGGALIESDMGMITTGIKIRY